MRKHPKHLLHLFHQQGISKVEDVHAYQVQVEEVKEKVLHLYLINTDADEIGKPQISEHVKLEEEWDHVLDSLIIRIS